MNGTHFVSVAIDDEVHCIFGVNKAVNSLTFRHPQVFDPFTTMWRKARYEGFVPLTRRCSAATTVGDLVLIHGGIRSAFFHEEMVAGALLVLAKS
jgi:hypothetical protein